MSLGARSDRFKGRLPKWPQHDEREEEGALRVLRSGAWWREAGGEVAAFEREFASFVGVPHVRAVTNGSQAIELALACLRITDGDEVLVPASTFIATASAVLSWGATPIPVDVERDTLCIDVRSAEAAITPRTRAVLPVHMAGHTCDMKALGDLCAPRGIDIIEDAAHAHGAEHEGRPAGSIGRCSIFSFQAGKLMTAGEGGAFATTDESLAAQTFERHSCGRPPADREYLHNFVATNMRLSEIQAAILRVQLTRLKDQLAIREERAAYLDRLLGGIPGVTPLGRRPWATRHSHYMYMAWLDPGAFGGLSASQIALELRALGLPAFRCFPAVQRTRMFSEIALRERFGARAAGFPDYRPYETPVADAAGAEVLWLHHSVLLAEHGVLDDVAAAIGEVQSAR